MRDTGFPPPDSDPDRSLPVQLLIAVSFSSPLPFLRRRGKTAQ